MKYEHISPNEILGKTRKICQQLYGPTESDYRLNAADCKIFMRGQVWIVSHEGNVLYYETHSEAYPFFENAFHYMNVEKRAVWKTVGELINFRNAIREATVQGTDCCDLLEEALTIKIYRTFMRMARAHDLIHHGMHTF